MIKYTTSFLRFLRNDGSPISHFLYIANEHALHAPSEYRTEYAPLLTTAEVNYLNFKDNGNISFLPAGKPHIKNEDGEWSKEGRQEGKASRVIRKLFTEEGLKRFKDADFETFANRYKAAFANEGLEFELLPSSEIGNIYDSPASGGSIGESCMRGMGKEGYMEIYKACEKLEILVLWAEKKSRIAGRCLVWTATDVNSAKEFKVMDRVYYSKDHYMDLFKEYAREHQWLYKTSLGSRGYSSEFTNPQGKVERHSFKVSLNTNFDKYPYIDTFCLGGEGWLSNFQSTDVKYDYARTGGMRHGGRRTDVVYMITDRITHQPIPESEAVVIGAGRNSGLITHRDNTITLRNSDGFPATYWKSRENSNIVFFNNSWYTKDNCTWSEYRSEFIPTADSMWSSHHNSFIWRANAIRVGHQWYDRSEIGKSLQIDAKGRITKKQTELFHATTQVVVA